MRLMLQRCKVFQAFGARLLLDFVRRIPTPVRWVFFMEAAGPFCSPCSSDDGGDYTGDGAGPQLLAAHPDGRAAAALAERQGDRMKVSDKQARAMSILFALESSLDFDKGGDISVGLAQIYREARRLLLVGAKERSADPVDQARAIVAEIADAWSQIG